MKVTQYKTVRATETADLDNKVNAEIKNGFQPYGSPYAQERWLCQALIRGEEAKQSESPEIEVGENPFFRPN